MKTYSMYPKFQRGDTIVDIKTHKVFMLVVDSMDYYVVRKFFPQTPNLTDYWDVANRHYDREFIEQHFRLY